MTDRTARIRLGAPGLATIEIDGQDVSKAVRGFRLDGHVGQRHQLTLDLLIQAGDVDGHTDVHIPAATAALLLTLGWTPPDGGQPLDLTHPSRHDAMIQIIKREARRDPDWFRTLLRREGRPPGRQHPPGGNNPPGGPPSSSRLVKVDGVLTEGDASAAREVLRQMGADTYRPADAESPGSGVGMVVQPYSDHGVRKWVFRCWGADDGCEGLLSLGHGSESWAERARDRHVAEAHGGEASGSEASAQHA
ncbi:hypothetical protein [Streptomyces sp. NPDC018693]|uniref:hypothetical protein n=1 Tax=unclassified Streptomyces TaxID=2593676 RepID=UPI00378BFAA3